MLTNFDEKKRLVSLRYYEWLAWSREATRGIHSGKRLCVLYVGLNGRGGEEGVLLEFSFLKLFVS